LFIGLEDTQIHVKYPAQDFTEERGVLDVIKGDDPRVLLEFPGGGQIRLDGQAVLIMDEEERVFTLTQHELDLLQGV
jgi:hypothetical protein